MESGGRKPGAVPHPQPPARWDCLAAQAGGSVADKNVQGTPGIQQYLLSTCCMLGFGGGTESLGNQGFMLLR